MANHDITGKTGDTHWVAARYYCREFRCWVTYRASGPSPEELDQIGECEYHGTRADACEEQDADVSRLDNGDFGS
jgi:hypothetical protein